MSVLQAANVHFDATGLMRIGKDGSNIVIKTNGGSVDIEGLSVDIGPAYDQANAAYAQANSAYDAANNAGGATAYSANVGNGSANTFTITHNLNTQNIFVSVRENSSGYFVYPDIKFDDANTTILEFVSAPTTNQYYVAILGA